MFLFVLTGNKYDDDDDDGHFSRKETNIHPKLLIYYAYVVM